MNLKEAKKPKQISSLQTYCFATSYLYAKPLLFKKKNLWSLLEIINFCLGWKWNISCWLKGAGAEHNFPENLTSHQQNTNYFLKWKLSIIKKISMFYNTKAS